ncbi:unnamed protein product [Rhizoctonia solani]|uniref:Uncharacterized protein n=1 Tax=Rhizoctonia solani TaxID=456999 RepID=A0A8H3B5T6_9AGAM|nr:unnamed protein product [Rhizoctonia solani]
MGKQSPPTYSPRVASSMRSAVTALLSFVALPAIPLSSTLDTLIELVKEIVEISNTSKRQELIYFGEYVDKFVNHLVSALRNKKLVQDANVRKNLEELRKTLEKILYTMYYTNNSNGVTFRLRRALFPEEDQMQVVRMRQQLDDALKLFKFATDCELLARTYHLPNLVADPPVPPQQPTLQAPKPRALDLSDCQEKLTPNPIVLSWAGRLSPDQREAHAPQRELARRNRPVRSGVAFVVSGNSGPEGDELAAAIIEVNGLRRLFQRSRRPLPAMDLAVALGRYSDLLVKSGHMAEALTASQESADLFRSLAEKGPEIYYDAD